MKYVIPLNKVNLTSIGLVGGKNASTGEVIQNLGSKGIKIPDGFATTTEAFNLFLAQHHPRQTSQLSLLHLLVSNSDHSRRHFP